MWIFMSGAFLSIVQHKDDPAYFAVRARSKADIGRVFVNAVVHSTPNADYAYRTFLKKQVVADVIQSTILNDIDYTNFKNSVPLDESDRHNAYLSCWTAMNRFQQNRRAETLSGGKKIKASRKRKNLLRQLPRYEELDFDKQPEGDLDFLPNWLDMRDR